MADSELGELRRPPRPIEQRIERIARWKAQGLAGGTSDSPFPVDFVDGSAVAGVSEDGATGGEVPSWYFETFSVTSGSASTVTLTFVPIEYSEVVRLNGITLAPTVDYTISENVLTFADLTSLRLGIGSDTWTLDLHYAYTDTAEVPFEAPGFLTWTLNGSASISGATVRLNASGASNSGSMVCPTVIPADWSQIDVTVTMNRPSGGDGWQVILWDGATHGDTELNMGGTRYSAVFENTFPSFDVTTFESNDGTTTISDDDGSTCMTQASLTVYYAYRFSWVKTGTSTASVTCYRDDVLIKSSPTDLWVPSTARVGIWSFNGILSSDIKTVSAVDVLVSN